MDMPLVKSKNSAKSLPNSESLKKILHLVTRYESVSYFDQELTERFKSAKKDKEFEPLLSEAHKFAHNVALQEAMPAGMEWSGIEPLSAQQNFQEHKIAEEAPLSPTIKDREILFAYHIDDNSNYTGVFATNDGNRDEDNANFEQRFNAWLTVQNKSKDEHGNIFETTNDKKIRTNANGEPIKANPEEMRALVVDKDKGFESYLKAENSDIHLTMHHFSDSELQAAKQQEAELGAGASMGG